MRLERRARVRGKAFACSRSPSSAIEATGRPSGGLGRAALGEELRARGRRLRAKPQHGAPGLERVQARDAVIDLPVQIGAVVADRGRTDALAGLTGVSSLQKTFASSASDKPLGARAGARRWQGLVGFELAGIALLRERSSRATGVVRNFLAQRCRYIQAIGRAAVKQ
jgi:hypothetical protein